MSTAPVITPGAPAAPTPPAAPATPPANWKEVRSAALTGSGIRARVLDDKTAPPIVPPAAPLVTPPVAPAGEPAPVVPDAPRVRKVKPAPPLPAAAAPAAPAAPATPALPAPAAPAIDPEVQREIDLAAFAARRNPERYAGMDAKVRGFFEANQQLVSAKAKELGGERAQEFKEWLESDDYKGWLAQNRPNYQRGDKTKLAEDMIAERAREEARREMAPELLALERKTAELEHAPVIHAQAQQAMNIVLTDTGAEKDPALAEFIKNPNAFGEKHPEEAQLIVQEANDCVEMVREVIRLEKNLVDFDARNPSPIHRRLREFSVAQNEMLREKHPNGVPMADGTILVDAATYDRLGLKNKPEYRTFTGSEIVGMLAATKNAELLTRLKSRREGVSKSFYAPRGAPTPPPAPVVPPAEPTPSPSAPTSAAPGSRGKPPADAWKETRRKALSGK